jgi:transposase
MVSKAEELVFSGKLDEAHSAVTTAVSSLDKAAQKGVIHPNNAARRKSRLLKRLNNLSFLKEQVSYQTRKLLCLWRWCGGLPLSFD